MGILEILFPTRCIGCGEMGSYLCADCINRCLPLTNYYCPACRKPSMWGQTHASCKRSCALDGLISCYVYVGLMKKIITSYKYSFVSDVRDTLVECMLSKIDHPQLFRHSWTVVPVPLHSSRKKWRGFNQASMLAKPLAGNWEWSYDDQLLVRHKETTPQMTLSGMKRKQNLHDAFSVTKTGIPSSILLIDDVATTCSTLMECARTLKQAGVQEVWGLTLAQTVPR